MFTQVFGSTTYAVSTVLTAFMAGLALGSYVFGRLIDRHEKWALSLYGILEGGIGLYALSVPFLITLIDSLHAWAYRAYQPSSWVFILMRFVICMAILLIPTTLMGATLPVMSRFVVRQQQTLGGRVGVLYGVNTAGAVLGCYCAGFIFIGSLGITRTLHLAVAANGLIMVVALLLGILFMSRRVIDPWPEDPVLSAAEASGEDSEAWKKRVILVCFAFAGFASLCYEVLWTRALIIFLGNSTYAFASMLTTFLCGLAIGSLVFARWADESRDRLFLFGLIEGMIAVWAVFSIPLLTKVFYFLGQNWQMFNIDLTWRTTQGLKFLKAFMVMFFPAMLMGAAFPVVCRIWSAGEKQVGRDVGSVYSVNTLGAIAGSAAAGFIVIPLLGVQKGIIAVAAINMSLAVVALFLCRASTARRTVTLVTLGSAVAVALFLIPKDFVFHRPEEIWNKLLFYREDSMALVKVYQEPTGHKDISINGYVVAGSNSASQEIQKGLAHLPMLLHDDPRTALIVGFGAGGTSWSISRYEPDRIDCIEFVPSMIKAAPYLNEVNHDVLSLPFYNVTIDDGRSYLLATDKKYDVLSVDAIDPKHAGSGNLYAVEFFQLCKDRLNPGGIAVEWLPYHLLTADEVNIILASFSSVFEHTSLWFTRYFNYLMLVGTDHELEIDYQRLRERMSVPKIAKDLKELDMDDPAEFIYLFAADTTAIKNLAAGAPGLNSYDRPLIEYYSPRQSGRHGQLPFREREGLPTLVNLGTTSEEIIETRKNIELHLDVAQRLIRPFQFGLQGDDVIKRLRQYDSALALDPDDAAARRYASLSRQYVKERHRKLLASAERNPSSRAYAELSGFYYQAGDLPSAVSAMENAVRLNPDFSEGRIRLTNLYERVGESEKALDQRSRLRKAAATAGR